jgi:hypothetical protein
MHQLHRVPTVLKNLMPEALASLWNIQLQRITSIQFLPPLSRFWSPTYPRRPWAPNFTPWMMQSIVMHPLHTNSTCCELPWLGLCARNERNHPAGPDLRGREGQPKFFLIKTIGRGKYCAAGIANWAALRLGTWDVDSEGIHPRRGRGKSQRGGYPAKTLQHEAVALVSQPC